MYHSPGDPHSHLALQALPLLLERFDVALELVLLGSESLAGFASSAEHVQGWTLRDGQLLQGLYADLGLTLGATTPSLESAALAAAAIGALCPREASGAVPLGRDLLEKAIAVGRELWARPHGDFEELRAALQELTGRAPIETAAMRQVLANNYERLAQKHLAGGVLSYRGEMYWGLDRLAHLERRLVAAGACQDGTKPVFARNEQLHFHEHLAGKVAGPELELVYSFRSPYSQLILRDLFKLCRHYGVPIRLRPVLPMAMRGLDVSTKKVYIVRDFWREKNRLGLAFDAFNDPIGEPTLRALRIWPLAESAGRGQAFLLAWADLVYGQFTDAGSDAGLRRIVEAAGLSWADAEPLANGSGVPPFEAENRKVLLEEMKHWGVPCVRYGDFMIWGQDRLWALESEFIRRCQQQ